MSAPTSPPECRPHGTAPDPASLRSPRAPDRNRTRLKGLLIATVARSEGDTGVQTHTRMLREGVARVGPPCTVVSPFSGSRKWLPVFAVRPLLLHRIDRSLSTRWYRHWHLAALRENLRRSLALGPAAAVVAQCPLSARAALDVRADLSLDFRVALACHFNGSEAQEYRDKGELDDEAAYRAIVALEDEVLRTVDQVIHVSHWSRQAMESCRAIRPRASTVIWNGIAATNPSTALTRADLGLGPDDLVLINVGTLEPRKNQVGLLDLFAALCARYPRARLLLVGDGPLRGEVRRKVEQERLVGRVKLLGSRPDVPALLMLADLYIHYATLENCPVVMLEAARAGLPSAAVPVGGIAELQARLESSVALPAADVEASLRALEPLLSDPTLRAEWGRRARRNFDRTFTSEAMAAAYLDVLGLSTRASGAESGALS